ncbi:hypothetical protein P171DRAFT_215783 [Karstenula rhodostoma CBS 690.94]|uniref:Uncharacterized protein n=1 Tax=Karstenula rhodostoma CBS 690.94 TaxID=1392251 RepID=A0A9P4PTL3_9PLEO|nr:hypothetical protein P171DRAFT_215783 [Karstenula rhodostoma CBS 690.94]
MHWTGGHVLGSFWSLVDPSSVRVIKKDVHVSCAIMFGFSAGVMSCGIAFLRSLMACVLGIVTEQESIFIGSRYSRHQAYCLPVPPTCKLPNPLHHAHTHTTVPAQRTCNLAIPMPRPRILSAPPRLPDRTDPVAQGGAHVTTIPRVQSGGRRRWNGAEPL